MKNEKIESTNYLKILSIFVSGMLIPLIAASIPWLLTNFSPNNSLTFTYTEPIKTKKSVALKITITNEGRKTQKNIEVWIPLHMFSTTKKKTDVVLETSLPYEISEQKGDNYFIKFKTLRPNESVKITIFGNADSSILLFDSELEHMRIVSENTIGTSNKPNQFTLELYKTGSFLLILLIIIILIWGIYYDYFMPFEKKEKYLLKQIDELTKNH